MTGTGRITNTGLRHDDRGVSRWLEIVARNHVVADEHVVDAHVNELDIGFVCGKALNSPARVTLGACLGKRIAYLLRG